MVEKGGKQGVTRRPLSGQVSVSPQGFPSKKNPFPRAWPGFAPLFTGQLFIVHLLSTGTCAAKTHNTQRQASDMSGPASGRRADGSPGGRHGGPGSIRKFIHDRPTRAERAPPHRARGPCVPCHHVRG